MIVNAPEVRVSAELDLFTAVVGLEGTRSVGVRVRVVAVRAVEDLYPLVFPGRQANRALQVLLTDITCKAYDAY